MFYTIKKCSTCIKFSFACIQKMFKHVFEEVISYIKKSWTAVKTSSTCIQKCRTCIKKVDMYLKNGKNKQKEKNKNKNAWQHIMINPVEASKTDL